MGQFWRSVFSAQLPLRAIPRALRPEFAEDGHPPLPHVDQAQLDVDTVTCVEHASMQHEAASAPVKSCEVDKHLPVASHPGANRRGPRNLAQRPDSVWVTAYVVETDFGILRINAPMLSPSGSRPAAMASATCLSVSRQPTGIGCSRPSTFSASEVGIPNDAIGIHERQERANNYRTVAFNRLPSSLQMRRSPHP